MKANKLTIALASSTFLPSLGGAEVGLHNIATRLLERGHKPIVIVPYTNYRQLKKEQWHLPYEIVSLPPRSFALLKHFPKLGLLFLNRVYSRLQKKYRFDFWHVTIGYPTGVSVAYFADKHKETNYLVRCAGEDIQKVPEINYGMRLDSRIDNLVRQYLPKCNHLVAISNSVADEYKAIGVKDSQIEYIPNGIDLSRFDDNSRRYAVRKSLGVGEDDFLFLAVGRNHPKKNFSTLVTAAKFLFDKGERNFKILIVGGGSSQLNEQAKKNEVENYLITVENINPKNKTTSLQLPAQELLDIYLAADCFSFPSLVETFGIVIIEAMAAGLPIITTDGPGCRDLIRNGQDGIMVPVDDVNAFAKSMQKVMTDDHQRDRLSKSAKNRAMDFSWDTIVDNYINVYRS